MNLSRAFTTNISKSKTVVSTEPEVLTIVQDERCVRIDMRIPVDLGYFEGHFPGCQLLPGVVQINWAIEFGRKYFPAYFAARPRFTHLANIKFMRVIMPGKTVTLVLRHLSERGELAFEYRSGEWVCSSGQTGFAA